MHMYQGGTLAIFMGGCAAVLLVPWTPQPMPDPVQLKLATLY